MWLCDNTGGLGEHVTCYLFWLLKRQWTDYDNQYVVMTCLCDRTKWFWWAARLCSPCNLEPTTFGKWLGSFKRTAKNVTTCITVTTTASITNKYWTLISEYASGKSNIVDDGNVDKNWKIAQTRHVSEVTVNTHARTHAHTHTHNHTITPTHTFNGPFPGCLGEPVPEM